MENATLPKTILFIDDDEDDKYFFSEAAHKLDSNITCVFAGNGQAALDLLQTDDTQTPDIIFVDINMPKMGGLEFLKKIKQCPKLGKIPVFVYSTSKLESEFQEATLLGALHFFIKPLHIHKIRECISFALQRAFELQPK
jgi:CheY-like chemotaxis protein